MGNMHTVENDGLEIHFSDPDLHRDEIMSIMNDLHKQIEEIDTFPDRSLFFQNPKIFDGWLKLIRTIRKIEKWDTSDDNKKWENRTETYVAYLLNLRALYTQYINLVKLYYEELKKLIDDYERLRKGDCISANTLNALFAEYDPIELNDINLYLPTINTDSHDARDAIFVTLTHIFSILSTIMDSGLTIIINLNPSLENFTLAIENDLREWNCSFGMSMFKDMKKQMDENGELMRLIYSSCYTDELFDVKKVENIQKYVELLTPDNLSIFYDIIVRRNLIQCEMYSELKAQHDEWLNPSKVDKTENSDMLHTQEENEEGVNSEEPTEEKRFRFIHVEIEDEEAWSIHRAIKRLVTNYSIPEICKYLKKQKQNGKLMLPSDSSAMYNELIRLGMPKGKGFSEKNFSNSYTK